LVWAKILEEQCPHSLLKAVLSLAKLSKIKHVL